MHSPRHRSSHLLDSCIHQHTAGRRFINTTATQQLHNEHQRETLLLSPLEGQGVPSVLRPPPTRYLTGLWTGLLTGLLAGFFSSLFSSKLVRKDAMQTLSMRTPLFGVRRPKRPEGNREERKGSDQCRVLHWSRFFFPVFSLVYSSLLTGTMYRTGSMPGLAANLHLWSLGRKFKTL